MDRFPSATCTHESTSVRVELTVHDMAYRARAQMEPVGRVAVQLPSTDGFELSVSWTDRVLHTPRQPSFDDSCLVETNDVSLASLWLDGEARSALLASRYVSGTPEPLRVTVPMMRDGAWQHELRSDEVMASRSDAESSPERVADMLAATLALATRPVRWARLFAPVAKALGGEAASRVELGGRPVVRVRRGQVDVTVRLLRRLGPADQGRLRTVVGAHRLGTSGETLTLISDNLPRTAWPPANGHSTEALRIDDRARGLLDTARPGTTIVRRHDVEITFDGAFGDTERLGAAIELAAYWAGERNHVGPYR
ncbi:MAG TPA: hypothetical protein VIV11_40145 [Kofleriaceae bacterium]